MIAARIVFMGVNKKDRQVGTPERAIIRGGKIRQQSLTTTWKTENRQPSRNKKRWLILWVNLDFSFMANESSLRECYFSRFSVRDMKMRLWGFVSWSSKNATNRWPGSFTVAAVVSMFRLDGPRGLISIWFDGLKLEWLSFKLKTKIRGQLNCLRVV